MVSETPECGSGRYDDCLFTGRAASTRAATGSLTKNVVLVEGVRTPFLTSGSE